MKISYIMAMLSFGASTWAAAGTERTDDQWQWTFAPMAWFSGIEGDITSRGNTAEVDVGFSDLWGVTEYGFFAYLEGQRNRFGFFAEPNYIKLKGDEDSPQAEVDFEQDLWLVEGGVFFTLLDTESDRPFTLDLTVGARYFDVQTELRLKNQGSGNEFGMSSSTTLVDPTVGLRARMYITRDLSLTFRGDVGGLGISEGNTSDFSWQALGLLGYDFTECFGLYGGYRGLGIDTSEGSGSREKGYDLIMHGVLIGAAFNW